MSQWFVSRKVDYDSYSFRLSIEGSPGKGRQGLVKANLAQTITFCVSDTTVQSTLYIFSYLILEEWNYYNPHSTETEIKEVVGFEPWQSRF
jgi:hypothetical protein